MPHRWYFATYLHIIIISYYITYWDIRCYYILIYDTLMSIWWVRKRVVKTEASAEREKEELSEPRCSLLLLTLLPSLILLLLLFRWLFFRAMLVFSCFAISWAIIPCRHYCHCCYVFIWCFSLPLLRLTAIVGWYGCRCLLIDIAVIVPVFAIIILSSAFQLISLLIRFDIATLRLLSLATLITAVFSPLRLFTFLLFAIAVVIDCWYIDDVDIL